ncbi:MAG: hypothetical protein A3F84_28645 [Candidatus Handelsmanbacteria bacterium RIFCSPLOWO2_12_FULL_64_10]|uniref:Uncharacterized protein n=1 Tax=Handelsmanbacteria sp. (strain RIFCSPLOWO2_12_FULL_64_10) TaxID=1817868 RepID=A0A1F6D454_HANXR|nr:MAG: hypothetical protein A3F84_28645 [Candidatus Handelsmanbacteria bacterium RIFCSPLOWO2_12_FULL_64_10]
MSRSKNCFQCCAVVLFGAMILAQEQVYGQAADCSNPRALLQSKDKKAGLLPEVALLPIRDQRVTKGEHIKGFLEDLRPLGELLKNAFTSEEHGLSVEEIVSPDEFINQDYRVRMDIEQYGVLKTSGGKYIAKFALQVEIVDSYAREKIAHRVSTDIMYEKKIKEQNFVAYEGLFYDAIRQRMHSFVKEWRDNLVFPFKIVQVLAEAPLGDNDPAKAKKVALLMGLQEAVKQAWGVEVGGLREVKDLAMSLDEVKESTKGMIRSYRTLAELPCPDKGILYLVVQAKILNPALAR